LSSKIYIYISYYTYSTQLHATPPAIWHISEPYIFYIKMVLIQYICYMSYDWIIHQYSKSLSPSCYTPYGELFNSTYIIWDNVSMIVFDFIIWLTTLCWILVRLTHLCYISSAYHSVAILQIVSRCLGWLNGLHSTSMVAVLGSMPAVHYCLCCN